MRDIEIIPLTILVFLLNAVMLFVSIAMLQKSYEQVVIVEATVEDVFRADDSDYEVVVRDGQTIEFIPITKKQFYLFEPQKGDCFRLEKHIQPMIKIYGDYYELLGVCEQ